MNYESALQELIDAAHAVDRDAGSLRCDNAGYSLIETRNIERLGDALETLGELTRPVRKVG